MPKLFDKMCCTDPYDIHKIVHLQSATIASRNFAMFSDAVLVYGRPERTLERLSILKACSQKNVLPNASTSM